MIIDIGPKFDLALSLPYNLQVKVMDLEVLCFSFTPKFFGTFSEIFCLPAEKGSTINRGITPKA